MPALLKPRPAALRARLWALRNGVPTPALPRPSEVAIAPPADWPVGFAEALGWIAAGPMLLRLDIAERVGAELAAATRKGPLALPSGLTSRLSIKADLLPVALRRLGFRVLPAAPLPPDAYGPPAPAIITALRRRRPLVPAEPTPVRAGPFAALATLRR